MKTSLVATLAISVILFAQALQSAISFVPAANQNGKDITKVEVICPDVVVFKGSTQTTQVACCASGKENCDDTNCTCVAIAGDGNNPACLITAAVPTCTVLMSAKIYFNGHKTIFCRGLINTERVETKGEKCTWAP